ncbi:hypothetical protein MNQ96_17660 [Sphingopyxis granuli]|uniref:hypothetical protein n=1 Tax=Sphingopyxis TaxID=165697 RepID=UPI0008366875|nr:MULTISPECIES: hypothetical protein [Sphingopyxis]APW73609.1 hypothetical protein BWD40_13030 [Sphingopyxis granuli]AVA14755.1 hypothetical protein C3E99_13620 [Sphingopyxis sp. MG]ODU27068.1 MAG: hypothetical protein ABS88_17025 [Sphingopyxis sp. SCN 67-31]QUM73425.1 hypothetical protein ICN83_05945 [Sphingopyxis granuli]UNK79330.1 hypothetical protein MNQ96_17660 [Sphingopyxis granuli]
MRLLLTLLALLTGLAGADRAVAAPLAPATMGSLVLLADVASQSENNDKVRRPVDPTPTRRASCACRKAPRSSAPHLPGLLGRIDRALE